MFTGCKTLDLRLQYQKFQRGSTCSGYIVYNREAVLNYVKNMNLKYQITTELKAWDCSRPCQRRYRRKWTQFSNCVSQEKEWETWPTVSPLGGDLGDVLVQVVLRRETGLLDLHRDSHGSIEQTEVENHGVGEDTGTEEEEVENGLGVAAVHVSEEMAAEFVEDGHGGGRGVFCGVGRQGDQFQTVHVSGGWLRDFRAVADHWRGEQEGVHSVRGVSRRKYVIFWGIQSSSLQARGKGFLLKIYEIIVNFYDESIILEIH